MGILKVRHYHSRYRQHEAAENLFGIIIDLGAGKTDA